MFLIDFYHPSFRGEYKNDYYKLLDIIKNIKIGNNM
jgi:hypothetical protein